MTEPAVLVRVIRSGLVESIHSGDVAVVDGEGRLIAYAGDPGRLAFARSSMKPLQATVSLSRSPFDYDDGEVAVMCASHNAEPVHVATVRSLLSRASVSEDALQCPAVLPWDQAAAIASPERLPVHSDCSGKHAGMLGASRAEGWPLEEYRSPDHPLQRLITGAVMLATGIPDVRIGIDGCGAPVHGMPLAALATVYARLARPERLGALEPFARRAVGAMRAVPYLVAGRDRVDTAVMEAQSGVIVKAGAEAMICAALLDRGVGIAVKIRDGGPRATAPSLLRVLERLDAVDTAHAGGLQRFARPAVTGGGEPVGELVADFELARS